jgi:hypothetical protein
VLKREELDVAACLVTGGNPEVDGKRTDLSVGALCGLELGKKSYQRIVIGNISH